MTKIKNDLKIQIDTLRSLGHGYKFIGKRLGVKPDTVKKYLRDSARNGDLPPKVRLPKHYFQGRIPLRIKRYLQENPIATLAQIKEACNLDVDVSYLGKYLKSVGLQRTKAKRGALISNTNKKKRVAFAKKLLSWEPEKLKRIMFSDETMVKSYPNGEMVFYRSYSDRKELVSPHVQQGGAGQMFWGCASFLAYGCLVQVNGHIDGPAYLDILKNNARPELEAGRAMGVELIYQQDNARPHKTAPNMAYMESWGFEVLDWPPQSPDLSPIENVWNMAKQKLKAMNPRPRKPSEIRQKFPEIWMQLPDNARKKLFGDFRKRLVQCVRNKGEIVRL